MKLLTSNVWRHLAAQIGTLVLPSPLPDSPRSIGRRSGSTPRRRKWALR